MAKKFTRIGLVGRPGMKDVSDTLIAVVDYLQAAGFEVWVEQETAKVLSQRKFPCFTNDQLGKKVDLLIVVGGDGSLLNAAPYAVEDDIAVLGINRGRLGFLTDIRPQDLEQK